MRINPEYDTDVFCIWCKKAFVLAKKEIWYKPYLCPSCHLPMGIPIVTHGSRRGTDGIMHEFHEARDYRLDVHISKTKLVKFLETLRDYGHCVGIWTGMAGILKNTAPWIVSISISEGFHFDGARFENPPILSGQ